jgi:hypothetical protein
MTRLQIDVDRARIGEFCRKRQIVEFALFGSVLREDFGPESDVDVLVAFAPDARHGLFELATMEEELASIFWRRVNLVERGGVRNPFRRRAILSNLLVLYAA